MAEEDEDTNYNMTYMKNKPTKVKKKKFAQIRIKIHNAQLKSMFAAQTQIPSFEEAKSSYDKIKNTVNHKNGFTFVPHLNRAFRAPEGKELHKIFGNGKDPLHAIAVTDELGKELNENHKIAYES